MHVGLIYRLLLELRQGADLPARARGKSTRKPEICGAVFTLKDSGYTSTYCGLFSVICETRLSPEAGLEPKVCPSAQVSKDAVRRRLSDDVFET